MRTDSVFIICMTIAAIWFSWSAKAEPSEHVKAAIEAGHAYYHPKTGQLVWRKCEAK